MKILAVATALSSLAGAEAQQSQPRQVTEEERRAASAALDRFTSPTLARFGSEAEFGLYAAAWREYRRTRGDIYYDYSQRSRPIIFAQAAADEQVEGAAPLCDPALEPCPELQRPGQMIMVTGSRVAPPRNPSITNNQVREVEEGDIVKQIDRFLIVLQDGRLFVVDTDAGGARLALTDRADVYRDPESDMWYDEMLVFGDRVLVTGYSYDERATELAVFRLSPSGRLAREGVFRIASNDYYSTTNYATRLIDGNLVTYTPLSIDEVTRPGFRWPIVRRWLPVDDARIAEFRERLRLNWRLQSEEPPLAGPALVDAADIYRPVRRIEEEAVVHTVSLCPLASAGSGMLTCRSTAFVGPGRAEWHVTDRYVYLWTADSEFRRGERCDAEDLIEIGRAQPALVYRVPLSGAEPDVVGARGEPPDQFALQADARHFHALVRLEPQGCYRHYDDAAQLAFVSLPLERFGRTLVDAPGSAFTDLPGTQSYSVASRFTDRYLVYGGLSRFRRGYPDPATLADFSADYRRRVMSDLEPRPAYVVPIHRPEAVRALTVGHSVIRAERVADDIVLTGYRDRRGLSLTLIDLDSRPRIGSTVTLAGRYESEGRSHAFNSRVDGDGSGLMGLPTVPRIEESDRAWWRSRASDLSFLRFDPQGRMVAIGELLRRFDYADETEEGEEDEDGVPGYTCEVSCIDWYGNSRPIFTDGRIFALAGAELIEGRIADGRIVEVQRLNIALSRPR